MNLMAMNNKGMTETISVMITVHATRQTAETMVIVLPQIAARLWWAPAIAAQLIREAGAYQQLLARIRPADNLLSANAAGYGWRMLSAMDRLNQAIKTSFPPLAYAKMIELARQNGADQMPYSMVLPGLPASGLPLLPVARGPERIIVDEADKCVLPKLKRPVYPILIFTGPLSSPLAIGTFEAMVQCNKSSLRGEGGVCGVVSAFTPMLRWPADAPRPMILTDTPARAGAAMTNADEAAADLARVRQYLQFLTVTLAQLPRESAIGNRFFANPANRWLTYAQADTYNPSEWSMFRQDWRGQIVSASLFGEKVRALANIGSGGAIDAPSAWSFVNTH
jgi:hypothetical protein